ncbi:MAG: formate--tetrahydrofolate ligase [Pseudomonadota bacterium]
MANHPSDLDIAKAATLKPIQEIGAKLGLSAQDLIPYGHDKAKISREAVNALDGRTGGKLVLVTAVNPTPAGEGKTTTTIGLGDGLNRIGQKALTCIREASLGPCFGVKGGAAGGGHAQVVPMEDMNLHFTGDLHAVTAAHNLLSAMIDNHIHWGNALEIDPRRVAWPRVVDMNDRALRRLTHSLGGPANGFPREDRFDITVASEVMAILCLATSLEDLAVRLGRIVVGSRKDGTLVTAQDLKADGAMAVLLRDALQPNLVQTLENNPVLVHGGPFANIAHGCNSLIATNTALKLADYVVTEAGFGADLGAEKFLNIKCRTGSLHPDGVVLVATVRALKFQGGVARADLGAMDVGAVERGCANLGRHIENIGKFGVPLLVAINHFAGDHPDETRAIQDFVETQGTEAVVCTHWADGSAGTEALAERVVAMTSTAPSLYAPLYPDAMPLTEKIETVAREIYRAGSVRFAAPARKQIDAFAQSGFGDLPVCLAKTPYSFSADPAVRGAPEGFEIMISDVRLSAGAGFVVALTGDIMTMPGLPRVPAAETIGLDQAGNITGLF